MPMTIDGDGSITGLVAGGLPNATIVQADLAAGVAGTGPAFSAYQSSSQSISATTFTKIQFQTEEFDTANCFDSTTNYRFTPNVAGYYQISGAVGNGSGTGYLLTLIYKNGTVYKRGSFFNASSAGQLSQVSALVYFNGSTDYVEIYAYQGITASTSNTEQATYFQGVLVRAA